MAVRFFVLILIGVGTLSCQQANTPQQPARATSAAVDPHKLRDIAEALRVVKFMALYPTSQEDDRHLQEALSASYDPKKLSYDGIHQVYRQIQNCSSDMLPSSHLRENLWQVMGPKMLSVAPAQRDAAILMMLKYNPVVVQANGKVVTKAAVQDTLAARTIVAKTAGISLGNQAERDVVAEACRQVSQKFASMSAAEQDALVRGESRYQALLRLGRAGGAVQEQAIALMKQAHSEAEVARITTQLEDRGTAYVKQNRSVESLINANNQIFRMGLLANQFTALSARAFK